MTFLIDENLSHHLTKNIAHIFPGCRHVKDIGLANSSDALIWAQAQSEGVAILSKDDDFCEIVQRAGAPPKLVWLRLGNASTEQIARALETRADEIKAFLNAAEGAILEIAPS